MLATYISGLSFLRTLKLNFAWWGHGNPSLSDAAIKDLTVMVTKLSYLRRVALNLDKWAKKNSKITEKSVK